MNRLTTILAADDVLVDVAASSKTQLFDLAGRLFESHHAIAMATVTGNLMARERLGSTGLGHGVAIPHGRIDRLKQPVAAILRLREPIPFDAPDDEPVGLLFFLFVPEAATQQHLEILSEIVEMLADRDMRERLKSEHDAAGLLRLLTAWHVPLAPVDAKGLRRHHRSQ